MNVSMTGAAMGATPFGAQAPAGGSLGKEEFLQLLVAQMRHQDPLNPMDGTEFVSQLAEFSSVEKLIEISDQLAFQGEVHQAMIQAQNASAAVGVIGKTVLAASDRIGIGAGEPASVTVELASLGTTGTLRLYDESGREVGTRSLGPLRAGRHTFDLTDLTKGLDEGVYRFEVEIEDSAGSSVPVITYSTARVSGVRYGLEGPMLLAGGGLEIPLGNVVEITSQD